MKAKLLFLLLCVASLGLLAEKPYLERYRPQFHFSPAANWTNDPCGLVYAFGKYHLFFQHNPFANVWGNMSWGHAVSLDLVHWKQLPVAIAADPQAAIFTGSSVFDQNNTSGLCASAQHGCIVSIYTGNSPKTAATREKQTQNLAFSDDGVTWTKYSANPILDLGRSDTRDPKVFWYEPTRRWIMVIVVADQKKLRFFDSFNLKEWHALSEFGRQGATGGVWECPDLNQLPVPGKPGQNRWILKVGINPGHIAGGSGEQYFIGHFDGTRFINDNPPSQIHWLDYGRDSYCALTFNNQPHAEAPRMIGWMNNWQYAGSVPTSPWRGSMTLPRSLSLSSENGNLTLLQNPLDEIRSLRSAQRFEYSGAAGPDLNQKLAHWTRRTQTFEMTAVIRPGSAKQLTWNLLEGEGEHVTLGYDAIKSELFVDRSQLAASHFNDAFPSRTVAPLTLGGSPLDLHVFVDRSSIEVFAQNGRIAITNLVFPKPQSIGLSLNTGGDRIEALNLKIWNLHSAWQ